MGTAPLTIHTFIDDLDEAQFQRYMKSPFLAVDTETMGLDINRDRLCVVQMCDVTGEVSVVQIRNYQAPRLKALMEAPEVEKIFHFARFDLATMKRWLDIEIKPVFCTKIASKLVRTYTGSHGLKDVSQELLGVVMDKQQQSSDWGAEQLTPEQLQYAASDVIHLVEIRARLVEMLAREGRLQLADEIMRFLPTRVALDLLGWNNHDIFSHASI
ncbi:3'-5' exonuclease [Magnetococcus marinus MC-1]|uniref:3'-5' exonuclease n=1 Tax=Magnetococcus marinus (strain ATCC BAA-1437 / JCM 17883 / MC-1) TaxID=156889 RepID=A0L4G0_MAGMM|nr:ribonuclease H-like domain-containing protein [Magnetococcus marinus]ABK42853.1 3'-5' exonuclease [Magnetococcus marinus MC-1]